MQLLILESNNDEPVVKSTVKGLTAAKGANLPTSNSSTSLPRASTASDRAPGVALEHVSTGSTMSSINKTITNTNLENDAKVMYPFRVRHLGKSEVYTLYAPTARDRAEWCEKIILAKERHATALHAQNAEPFRLKVLADTAFVSTDTQPLSGRNGVPIRGTPLDRAIREMEREFGHARPGPVCRAQVNCATAFTVYGKSMLAVGTDYGVYIAEVGQPRSWTKAIQAVRVTQIAVLEEFSICLVISDKALIAYHLDAMVQVSNFPAPNTDSARRAPQKLSGSREVAFFATAKMKDRTLVFYKKREGISSTFKVLEPVFHKSTEKKSRLFGRSRLGGAGTTEFFREFDEFYIPTECFSINLFHTYIAISTARGFELLTLDRKQTMSIPDLKLPAIASIAARLNGQKPLGMFRLSEQEFLCAYEECAVYVDRHGEVSRSVVLEFVGKARGAALYGQYLVLFDSDFIEVRNAENGRLRQVIAGREVRCLDFGVVGASGAPGQYGQVVGKMGDLGAKGGRPGQRTLKVAMAHPEMGGAQLVVELVLNEGQRE
jgi:hypothetical protein